MLFVIDMQDKFLQDIACLRSRWSFVGSVAKVVRRANDLEMPIVFVEYVGHGKTTPALHEAARGQFHVIRKRLDNGSDDILSFLEEEEGIDLDDPANYPTLTFCGVNSDACVKETVAGVVRQGFKCRIVQEATANTWGRLNLIKENALDRIWNEAHRQCKSLQQTVDYMKPSKSKLRILKRF